MQSNAIMHIVSTCCLVISVFNLLMRPELTSVAGMAIAAVVFLVCGKRMDAALDLELDMTQAKKRVEDLNLRVTSLEHKELEVGRSIRDIKDAVMVSR